MSHKPRPLGYLLDDSCNIRTTFLNYKECNLTYDDAVTMTAERLNELIYPESFGRKPSKDEYRVQHPDGYSYSRFCAKFADWLQGHMDGIEVEAVSVNCNFNKSVLGSIHGV